MHEEENEIDDINGAYEEENNLGQAGKICISINKVLFSCLMSYNTAY